MYKVVVAGSINMDVVARVSRFPRAGETVEGSDLAFYPGGKGANQAVAAGRLGAETVMLGRVGDDAFASELLQFLSAQQIDLSMVRESLNTASGVALIAVNNESENTIIVTPGANAAFSPADVDQIDLRKGDVVVSQFEIPEDTIRNLFERAKSAGATTILNSAPAKRFSDQLADLVDVWVLNESELGFYVGETVSERTSEDGVAEYSRRIRRNEEQIVVVTLGRRGALALIGNQRIAVAGLQVDPVDATGAGDCYVGALAAGLTKGKTFEEAMTYANSAAAFCVQKPGAGPSMPTTDELIAAFPAVA